MADPPGNILYYGDNLDVLGQHVPDESVDLVYLDPPFNSQADYNVLFEQQSGERAAAQIHAFEDTWRWDQAAAEAFEEIVEQGGAVSRALQAFRGLLGTNDVLAYLSMMAPRLLELRRVLKQTGSIYLHCDVTASHHLKLLMDSIFGPENFRNEIIWHYYNKMHDRRKKLFPRTHDTILFYVKDVESDFTYHQLKEKRDKPFKQLARKKVDGRMVNVRDEKGNLVYNIKKDRTLDNVWRIPSLQPAAHERLGYPTQKPEALLERVLEASSNEGDLVLDPFCGCGTTIAVAEKMKRRWVGIDVTYLATALIKGRLQDQFGEVDFDVVGEPVTVEDAKVLARSDPYQFQFWALGLVGARPAEEKKGADRGIDGEIFFHDEKGGKTKQIEISVKAGKTGPAHVRDLRGVVDREDAEIGVLLTFNEPTASMRKEAADAGFYKSAGWGESYPRLQILTVGELLDGGRIEYPAPAGVTFRKAPRAQPKAPESEPLF